jgi:hypothetical protein
VRSLGTMRIAIGAGLCVLALGAFALGRSLSGTMSPAPAVVVEKAVPAPERPSIGGAAGNRDSAAQRVDSPVASVAPPDPVQAQPAPVLPTEAPAAETAAAPPAAGSLESDLEVALQASAASDALAILQKMAEGSLQRGDYAAAKKAYNDALEIAHSREMTEQRADQYANLGRLHWKEGNKTEAEAYWRAARDQYEQFELPAKVAGMDALLRKASPGALNSSSRPAQTGKKTSSIIELR